jgi:hypothetical protein
MLVLPVTATCPYKKPTIVFNRLYCFSDLHQCMSPLGANLKWRVASAQGFAGMNAIHILSRGIRNDQFRPTADQSQRPTQVTEIGDLVESDFPAPFFQAEESKRGSRLYKESKGGRVYTIQYKSTTDPPGFAPGFRARISCARGLEKCAAGQATERGGSSSCLI